MLWLVRVVNKMPVGLLWTWGVISTCLFIYVDTIYSEPPPSQTVSAPPRSITMPPAQVAGASASIKQQALAPDTGCYSGTWNEEPPSQNTWTFKMEEGQLHITRGDGAIFGVFVPSSHGDAWDGSLNVGNNTAWNEVVLQVADGCESIQTNLPWSFRRQGGRSRGSDAAGLWRIEEAPSGYVLTDGTVRVDLQDLGDSARCLAGPAPPALATTAQLRGLLAQYKVIGGCDLTWRYDEPESVR